MPTPPAADHVGTAQGFGAGAAAWRPVSGTMGLMRRPSPPALATLAAIGGVIVIVIWQCDPSLLLANTMTTGGDTGAHFGLAAFLKSNLLPHGQVTGWFPGAYDGLPLNTFYFPLPDTLAALLGYVIPFDIAFKFVTILGSITLPIAAWAFGRLVGMERPRPAVLAAFTLPFLFDQTFTIYGGNLYSTMAGEYAFSSGCRSPSCSWESWSAACARADPGCRPSSCCRHASCAISCRRCSASWGRARRSSSSAPPASECGGWSRWWAAPSSSWRGGRSPSSWSRPTAPPWGGRTSPPTGPCWRRSPTGGHWCSRSSAS